MKLRPYQQDAIVNTLESFKNNNAVMTVLATGLGKTIILSHLAKQMRSKGRILLLAHREELIHQGRDKLSKILDDRVDVEMADSYAQTNWLKTDAVVATVQTLSKERRIKHFNPDEFGLLIIDETHHATADSYRKVINHFKQNPNLKIYGTTATPDRTDEEALGQIFDDVSYEYGILDGINDGWLVPIEQQQVHIESLDLSGVRTTMGDLNNKELSKILEYEQNLHEIAYPTLELCGDKKTLVFAASVAQAERLAEIINRHKSGSAKVVTGTTDKDDRRQLLRDYRVGQFQYLVNVGIATEGFDEPGIECVVMAGPTKSRCKYTQCIGRGTRPSEDISYELNSYESAEQRRNLIINSSKPSVTVLDFVGNSGRHKLIHAADVLGGKYSDEIVEMATRNIESQSKTGRASDVISELKKAEQKIIKERKEREEQAIRDAIKMGAKYRTSKVDPFDLLDLSPQRIPAWHKDRPATAKQIAALQKFGIDTSEITSFVHASQLMDTLITRMNNKMATAKQVKLLKSKGINAVGLTLTQASKMIDAIAKNSWQVPDNLLEAVGA